jgi:hypothetical protein
LGLVTSRR